jgi:hypothetical protein
VKIRIALCGTFICVLSTIALAQAYVDYNHNIDFTKFKTYAWGQGANPNAINDSILAQSAQQAVDSQLARPKACGRWRSLNTPISSW